MTFLIDTLGAGLHPPGTKVRSTPLETIGSLSRHPAGDRALP